MRRWLLGVFILAGCLSVLEAAKDPGAADQIPRPGTPALVPLPAQPSDIEMAALASGNQTTRGWIPRGERPAVVVRRMPARELRELGYGFGPDFFPDPDGPVIMVELHGLLIPQHFGMIEYRPPTPRSGVMTLLFLPGYQQPFAWEISPVRIPTRG